MIQVSNEQIHRDSRIQDDLGVTGDDAVELLEAVHERYSTDLSQFPFDDYFGPEGCPPISYIYKWIIAAR